MNPIIPYRKRRRWVLWLVRAWLIAVILWWAILLLNPQYIWPPVLWWRVFIVSVVAAQILTPPVFLAHIRRSSSTTITVR
jgi:hypothetical protein